MTAHTPESLDGRLAQGWGGTNPNGVHVNVLLAERGSATSAAMATTFAGPTSGFTPILVCVGPDQPSYETVNPPTLMLNKTELDTDLLGALAAGACQVGIAQAVLDVVAEGLLATDQSHQVFVSLWLNPEAEEHEPVRDAARTATAAALREAVTGRAPEDARRLVEDRDTLTHPFYGG
ncbi:Formaldehyde-activating enzyme [Streptomyces sp. YIM 130001]|uniref:formaldehyde-activating enzyme n=1 Tax=Streptomyces sp. YIM 130001 TaxID=2259644 RepID=UPI000E65D1FD|nr:formaldehyde-activating enzyme [Streptomyces sp. YIM 130001]RII15869.1 Formaldehyde-activating enzyme [Streptomyces sp. YIM 130001]